jgi:hypothetical protein
MARPGTAAAGITRATADTAGLRPDRSETRKVTGTATTYPFPAYSQASRSLALRPYTSSAAAQANGTPPAAAPESIALLLR